MGLAEQLLENGVPASVETPASDEPSAFRVAMHEAWEALKADDLDAFSEAFEAAVEIKGAE